MGRLCRRPSPDDYTGFNSGWVVFVRGGVVEEWLIGKVFRIRGVGCCGGRREWRGLFVNRGRGGGNRQSARLRRGEAVCRSWAWQVWWEPHPVDCGGVCLIHLTPQPPLQPRGWRGGAEAALSCAGSLFGGGEVRGGGVLVSGQRARLLAGGWGRGSASVRGCIRGIRGSIPAVGRT